MAFLLRPISACSSWSLACHLAKPRRPEHETELQAMESELARRGKSPADIAEMIAFVRWAVDVLNPVPGQPHQIVADADDLELAVDVAGRTSSDARFTRDVIRHHLDER